MDAAKKKRTAAKAWLTKVTNNMREEAQNPPPNEAKLRGLIAEFDKRLCAYNECQSAVDELTAEDAIEGEVAAADAYLRPLQDVRMGHGRGPRWVTQSRARRKCRFGNQGQLHFYQWKKCERKATQSHAAVV